MRTGPHLGTTSSLGVKRSLSISGTFLPAGKESKMQKGRGKGTGIVEAARVKRRPQSVRWIPFLEAST